MNARRLVTLSLPLVFAAGIAWVVLHRQAPVVKGPAPRAVEGRVLDEGGVPVPDASVQLFDHADAWLGGKDAGCAYSLLACDSIAAGREVLRQVRNGGLVFPVARAKVNTDAEGRFSFPDVHEDEFVSVREGEAARVPASGPLTVRLFPDGYLSVRLNQVGEPGVHVLVIDPFTRDIARVESVERGEVSARSNTWAMAQGIDSTVITPAAEHRELVIGTEHVLDVQLDFDGGVVVDGAFQLDCDHFSLAAQSKDGGVRFEPVLAQFCTLDGEAGDFETHELIDATSLEATVPMAPVARLRVSIEPKAARGSVSVFGPGSGAFEALEAQRDFERGGALELRRLRLHERARVVVKADGFEPMSRDLPLRHGLNEVAFELERGKPSVVIVPDAGVVEVKPNAVLMGTVFREGKPAARVRLDVGEQTVFSNATGRFRFEGLQPGPQVIVVNKDTMQTFEVDAGAPDVGFRLDLR